MRTDQVAALAAGQADPSRVDAPGVQNLIGKIRVGKGHTAPNSIPSHRPCSTAPAAYRSANWRRYVGAEPSTAYAGHCLFDRADTVDHPGQSLKGVLVRRIFTGVKGAGDGGGGVGIPHRQADQVQAVIPMQLRYKPDRLCQIGRQTGTLADAKTIGDAALDCDTQPAR